MNLANKTKPISGIATFIIASIMITPVCGFLFKCGCDWPWLGLDENCNFYQKNTSHQCPWCASMLTGILSTITSIVAGVCIAVALPINDKQMLIDISMRIFYGLTIFILIAIFTAFIAASWQAYPLGIF